jgi:hypothetical protein
MKRAILLLGFSLGSLASALAKTLVNLSNTVTNPDPLLFGLNWPEGNSTPPATSTR